MVSCLDPPTSMITKWSPGIMCTSVSIGLTDEHFQMEQEEKKKENSCWHREKNATLFCKTPLYSCVLRESLTI